MFIAFLKSFLIFTISMLFRTIYDLIVFVDNLTEKFNALLTFLIAIGIVVDPTTQGISDSEQAMDDESAQ
ncbi:phage holin [Bacillus halotolerans]|nr:phage holin [Bacillus halotolerans]MBV7320483.1 phage holin [Halalkalibacterium halodurans]AZV47602.1 phage holin [Bacillus halotolerans]PRS03833.1 phage holin [Bacillus halotolerans]PRS23398.1 phage holin [Bacillus halotolerans]QDK69122.1 phage holin [Bacillus halotolerans]